jgi:dTDP-4-dehydrorhamnose reductase
VADQLLAAPAGGDAGAARGGVYHACGQGETSWHGFAVAIFAAASRVGWQAPPVDPIATADWPTPARRPPDSRLDCTRLRDIFNVQLPDWRLSLDEAVAAICQPALAAATG